MSDRVTLSQPGRLRVNWQYRKRLRKIMQLATNYYGLQMLFLQNAQIITKNIHEYGMYIAPVIMTILRSRPCVYFVKKHRQPGESDGLHSSFCCGMTLVIVIHIDLSVGFRRFPGASRYRHGTVASACIFGNSSHPDARKLAGIITAFLVAQMKFRLCCNSGRMVDLSRSDPGCDQHWHDHYSRQLLTPLETALFPTFRTLGFYRAYIN